MPYFYNPHIDELDYYGINNLSGSSTDNAVARWDGTTGIALQDSNIILTDLGNMGFGIAAPTAQIHIVNDRADNTLSQLVLKGIATQTADEFIIYHETGNPCIRGVCAGTTGFFQVAYDHATPSDSVAVTLQSASGPTVNFGTRADPDVFGVIGAYNSVFNIFAHTRDFLLYSDSITPIIQCVHTTGNVGVRVAAPTQMLQVGDGVIEPHTIYVKGPNSGVSYTCLELERKYPRIQINDLSGSNFQIWNLGNQLRLGSSAGSAENSAMYIDAGIGANATIYFNSQIRMQGSGAAHGSDYADFNVSTAGALTITTVDSAAAAGHINLTPDGMVAIGGTTDYTRVLNVLGSGIQVRENDDGNRASELIGDSDRGYLHLYSVGVEKVRFTGLGSNFILSGDLGIGTNAPDKNLEINDATGGELRLTYNDADGSATNYCDFKAGEDGNLSIITVDSDGNSGDIEMQPDGNVQVWANDRTLTEFGSLYLRSLDSMAIDLGGSIGFGGSYTGTSFTQWATISGRKESAVDGEYGGYLQLATRPHGGNAIERMRISSTGLVGIGTTDPDSFLEVDAGTSSTNIARFKSSHISSPVNVIIEATHANGWPLLQLLDTGSALGTKNWNIENGRVDGVFGLYRGATLFAIAADGNVGIGSNLTAPNNLLTIKKTNASVIFDIESDVDQLGVIYFSDTTQGRGQIRYNHTADEMTFWTTAGQKAVIDSSGQIGVGTTAPDKTIEVNAATGGGIRLTYNDADGSATDYCDLQVGANGDLTVTTVDSDGAAGHINLSPDGSVAIGTTDYTRTLNVISGIQVRESDDGNQAVLIAGDADEGFVQIYAGGVEKTRFQGIGDNFIMNGNLGIGEISPTALLHLDQSSTTGAKPVITVDQADVSEEFIRFIGTSADGVLTQSIVEEGDQSTSTLAGWLKIYVSDDGNQVTDQAYYIPFYTLA